MVAVNRDDLSYYFDPLLLIIFDPLLLIIVILFGSMAICNMVSTESMPGLYGTVEKVVSIVTVDGEEYKFDGDVAPREGDEIAFDAERYLRERTMKEWYLAD